MKESRLCLTEETVSTASNKKRQSWWQRRTFMEKKFCFLTVFLIALCTGLCLTAVWYYFSFIVPQSALIENARNKTTETAIPRRTTLSTTLPTKTSTTEDEITTTESEPPAPKVCLTQGCIRA
uniref:Uncharacterized protein n=1 Tax=Strigamia maritima TaxID=126957 RepID=T1JL67_STRMM